VQLNSGLHYVYIAHTKYYFEGITGTTAEGQAIPEEGQYGGNADNT